jgi:predicted transcriptional regulator
MSLTIQEKQELKLKVDSIELKNNEQINNKMMAKKGSYKDLFEENKNHLEKQISDKE